MASPPGLLNCFEVADRLGVSVHSVYRYIEKGQLKVVAEGCQKFIAEGDLEGFQFRPRGNPNFSKPRRQRVDAKHTALEKTEKTGKNRAGKKTAN